jgi:hypothetical protein
MADEAKENVTIEILFQLIHMNNEETTFENGRKFTHTVKIEEYGLFKKDSPVNKNVKNNELHTKLSKNLQLPDKLDDLQDLVGNLDFSEHIITETKIDSKHPHERTKIDAGEDGEYQSFIKVIYEESIQRKNTNTIFVYLYIRHVDDVMQKYMNRISEDVIKLVNDNHKNNNNIPKINYGKLFPPAPTVTYDNGVYKYKTFIKKFEIKNLMDGLKLLKYYDWVESATLALVRLNEKTQKNIQSWFGDEYAKFLSFLNLFKWLTEIKSYEKLGVDTVFGKFKIAFNIMYEKILKDKEIDKNIFNKYDSYILELKNTYQTEEIYKIEHYEFWFFLDDPEYYEYRVHILPDDLTQDLMNGLIDTDKYTIAENIVDKNAISSESINNIATLKTVEKRWFKFFLTKTKSEVTIRGGINTDNEGNVVTEGKHDQPPPTTPSITPPPTTPPLSPSSSPTAVSSASSSIIAVSTSSSSPSSSSSSSSSLSPTIASAPLSTPSTTASSVSLDPESEPESEAESEPEPQPQPKKVDINDLTTLLQHAEIRKLDDTDYILTEYGNMLNDFLND